MLSHIVFKGNRLSKFAVCTRSVKAQCPEQSISGLKCKQKGEINFNGGDPSGESIGDVLSFGRLKFARNLESREKARDQRLRKDLIWVVDLIGKDQR
jgi:hypothetical protein